MPTWSGILEELNQSRVGGGPPQFDAVRRKYLVSVYQHTGREVILYASKWTQHDANVSPDVVSIVDEDLQGIMEVIHGLSGPNLDLILHSPGGSLEAAEALVLYLRSKFDHIRVIVPQMAMSAATMIACAADLIVLGKHSFLGPIDPQIIINTPLGQRMVPAQAILEQFERAKNECQDPAKLGAWLPMLSQYGPDLLVQCEDASEMSKDLVKGWLEAYMLRRMNLVGLALSDKENPDQKGIARGYIELMQMIQLHIQKAEEIAEKERLKYAKTESVSKDETDEGL